MEFLCGLVIASGGSSRIGRGQARASVAARLVRAKTMAKTLLDKLSSSKQVHRSRASLPRLRRGASVVAVAAAFSSGSSTWVEGAWPISEQNTSEVRFGQLYYVGRRLLETTTRGRLTRLCTYTLSVCASTPHDHTRTGSFL